MRTISFDYCVVINSVCMSRRFCRRFITFAAPCAFIYRNRILGTAAFGLLCQSKIMAKGFPGLLLIFITALTDISDTPCLCARSLNFILDLIRMSCRRYFLIV